MEEHVSSNNVEIKFVKLSQNAKTPIRSTSGSAGFDIFCTSMSYFRGEEEIPVEMYHTDISVEVPKGHVLLVFPRSSIYKTGRMLANSVGVIDSDYRGEIIVLIKHFNNSISGAYNPGDRVAQLILMPIPNVSFLEVKELSTTDRNTGGFGSTGK